MDYLGTDQEQVADDCEFGKEHWGSIECGEFLDLDSQKGTRSMKLVQAL